MLEDVRALKKPTLPALMVAVHAIRRGVEKGEDVSAPLRRTHVGPTCRDPGES